MDPLPLHDLGQAQLKCMLRSRTVSLPDRDGLQTHFLEAFPIATSDPISLPLILLLHGFPELAYSWRKVLAPLAAARGGYHVVAPDMRGYGRTVMKHGEPQVQYDDPIAPFHLLNVADDVRSLVKALGHSSVAMIAGHDFGSMIARYCVIAHPELFRSVVFMSAPFVGVHSAQPQSHPQVFKDDGPIDPEGSSMSTLIRSVPIALASLTPPRKHYVVHNSSYEANEDFLGAGKEDLYHFLGRYYHMKSEYYIMPADEGMREVVDRHAGQNPDFTWPPEEAKAGWVFVAEFTRTGFQGGLNYYRATIAPPPEGLEDRLGALAKRRVSIPAAFVSGARDWGVFQKPGGMEEMKRLFRMHNENIVLIEGAGHWLQQETPDRVVAELLGFLCKVEKASRL